MSLFSEELAVTVNQTGAVRNTQAPKGVALHPQQQCSSSGVTDWSGNLLILVQPFL